MPNLLDDYFMPAQPDRDPEPLIMAAMVHLYRTLLKTGEVRLTQAECTMYQNAITDGVTFDLDPVTEDIILRPAKLRGDDA